MTVEFLDNAARLAPINPCRSSPFRNSVCRIKTLPRRQVLAGTMRVMEATMPDFFPGFEQRQIETTGATINLVTGGGGPALLLLHGYPQTHVMWRKVAPRLAQDFTVVVPDLRGYGDSSKPPAGENFVNYSKRALALDQVEVMAALGHDRFAVAGHDRGARVTHRLLRDHPDKITRGATLDIVPTLYRFETIDQKAATGSWHWFFLIQGRGLPEHMIGGDPEFFLRHMFGTLLHDENAIEPAAWTDYLRCFRHPETIRATCDEYRAGASIDLVHDRADLSQKVNRSGISVRQQPRDPFVRAVPMVRIRFPPAKSRSLSGYGLCPRKDAGFPPFWRPFGATTSGETREVQQHRAEEGSVSVPRYSSTVVLPDAV